MLQRSGADIVFAGKAFLWALGTVGDEGPAYLCKLVTSELADTLGGLGLGSIAALRET